MVVENIYVKEYVEALANECSSEDALLYVFERIIYNMRGVHADLDMKSLSELNDFVKNSLEIQYDNTEKYRDWYSKEGYRDFCELIAILDICGDIYKKRCELDNSNKLPEYVNAIMEHVLELIGNREFDKIHYLVSDSRIGDFTEPSNFFEFEKILYDVAFNNSSVIIIHNEGKKKEACIFEGFNGNLYAIKYAGPYDAFAKEVGINEFYSLCGLYTMDKDYYKRVTDIMNSEESKKSKLEKVTAIFKQDNFLKKDNLPVVSNLATYTASFLDVVNDKQANELKQLLIGAIDTYGREQVKDNAPVIELTDASLRNLDKLIQIALTPTVTSVYFAPVTATCDLRKISFAGDEVEKKETILGLLDAIKINMRCGVEMDMFFMVEDRKTPNTIGVNISKEQKFSYKTQSEVNKIFQGMCKSVRCDIRFE